MIMHLELLTCYRESGMNSSLQKENKKQDVTKKQNFQDPWVISHMLLNYFKSQQQKCCWTPVLNQWTQGCSSFVSPGQLTEIHKKCEELGLSLLQTSNWILRISSKPFPDRRSCSSKMLSFRSNHAVLHFKRNRVPFPTVSCANWTRPYSWKFKT